jgi:hypothetical protein
MTRNAVASTVALALLLACKGPGNRSPSGQQPDDDIDCRATTCQAEGKTCGTIVDRCGGTLQCGSCAAGETCGAGGANVCGVGSCTPTTCEAGLKDCGIVSDGCAGTLECGTCTAPEFCGGSGDKNVCGVDALAAGSGCSGPFNTEQILDLHLTFAPGDWEKLKADSLTNSLFFPADFSCGGDPALPFKVGVRRKRSGSIDKPGIKVDFNYYQAGAEWQTLKKLSLENGISEGGSSASLRELVAEYLGWRMMTLSGAHASRASFVRLFVNGAFIGTYVNVEQVDRRFLRSRLGDDTGWLYKHSGSSGDGYKTNSTIANPYEQYLCFWDKNPCPSPSAAELATYLPEHLDIVQMLRFGGVNALIANSDAPFVKDNNFIFYDYAPQPGTHRRVYLPWDLDTTMKESPPIFGGPGTTLYTSVLFTHWENDYDALLTELLAGPLQLSAIRGELDRVVVVAGAALDADPTGAGETTAGAVAGLNAYWGARHPQLTAELEAHAP